MIKNISVKLMHCVLVLLLTATAAQAQSFITIGNGTTNTNGNGADPVDDYYKGMHYQTVYTVAELIAAGLSSGDFLSSIGFEVTQSPGTLGNYKISLAHTTQANAATYIDPATTTFTLVVPPFSYTPTVQTAGNFDMINFSTNFQWDGISNIVVDICTGPANPYASPYGGVAVFSATDGASYVRSDLNATGICSQATNVAPTIYYSAGKLTAKPNVRFGYMVLTNCNGTPSAGTASVTNDTVCIGESFTLTLTNATTANGLSYQWQESPIGSNSWTPISPATGSFYSITMISGGSSDYRCVVSCGNNADTSTVISVYEKPFYNCYCASASQNPQDGEISNVKVGALNNSSTCTQTGGPGSILNKYSDYTTVISPDTLYQDALYPVSITAGSCGGTYAAWVKIFIDLDHDGAFTSSGEEVFSNTTSSTFYKPAGDTAIGTITLPSASFPLTGLTRMRVILHQSTTATPVIPCSNSNYGYGETEDYFVYIPGIAPSCGSVSAGTVTSSKDSLCVNEPFTIVATGYTTGQANIMYQWEDSSATTGAWNSIPNANNPVYTDTNVQTVETYYRFKTTCNTSGATAVSTTIKMGISPFYVCYCSPNTSNPLQSYSASDYIDSVSIVGTTLANGSSAPQIQGFFQGDPGISSQTTSLQQGVAYTLFVKMLYSGYGADVWFDWDGDGNYSNTEYYNIPSSSSANITLSITPPITAVYNGPTGMRIREYYTSYGASGACTNNNTYQGYETEDYVVTIMPAPSCFPPSALTATNITSTSADLGWTENNGATDWQVIYGPAPLSAATADTISTNFNPYSITSGLTPTTVYEFVVRSICAPGTDTSQSSTIGSFTTACALVTAINQNFATYLPPCWIEQTGPLGTSSTLTGTSSSWLSKNWLSSAANGTTASINLWTIGKRDWLISPSIDLGASGGNLQFDLAIVGYSSSTPAILGSDDTVAVVISTDNGATWSSANILQRWTAASGTLSANGTAHIALPLSAYSGLVKIGFYGSEGTVNDPEDNDIMIDNVVISPFPLAIKLADIKAANLGDQNKISWHTADEAEGDAFELQRSADGREFAYLFSQKANGSASDYTYMDKAPLAGRNYYRLKMTDANGRAEYSKTVEATVNGKETFAVRAYPNPLTGNNLTVEITGQVGNEAYITVTDLAGKTLKNIRISQGKTDVDMSNVASGVYFIKYRDEYRSHTLKLTK